jgi:signal transduction histidine kinase
VDEALDRRPHRLDGSPIGRFAESVGPNQGRPNNRFSGDDWPGGWAGQIEDDIYAGFDMARNRHGIRINLYNFAPITAALVIGLAGTLILTVALRRGAERADQTRFEMLTGLVHALYDARIEKYEQGLGAVREFFNQGGFPSQLEWSQLLDRLKPLSHYISLLEVGCGIYLTGSQLANPEPALGKAMPTNCVFPARLLPEEKNLIVLYRKSYPPLKAYAPGFNLLDASRFDITLWQTIHHSINRNSFALTSRIPLGLGGASTNVSGFYMVRSLFDSSLPLETSIRPNEEARDFQDRLLYERIPHVRGCLFGAIGVDQLLAEALKKAPLEVAFEIFDGEKPSLSRCLNDRVGIPTPADRLRRLDLTNRVIVWGRYTARHAMVFYPTADFEEHSPRRMAWFALGTGIAMTLGIAGLVWAQVRRRSIAEAHAREMDEAREVIETLSRERTRISRDLHDGVLQSMYAVGLGLQKTLRAIARDPDRAEEMGRHNLNALELAMKELRRHLGQGDFKSAELDMAFSLRQLTEIMTHQGQVPAQCHISPALRHRPSPATALQLLQIAREALINAERHSGAEWIRIHLNEHRDHLEMTITDNGRGFDPKTLPVRGLGLRNMADRSFEIGADFQLEAQPGKGVALTVRLPLARCVPVPGTQPGPASAPG